MSTIKVILADEQELDLKNYLYSLVVEAIEKARNDSSLDRMVVNQKEIAEHLGVSPTTIQQYEKHGLPFGSIGKRKFYNKQQCSEWVVKQQID